MEVGGPNKLVSIMAVMESVNGMSKLKKSQISCMPSHKRETHEGWHSPVIRVDQSIEPHCLCLMFQISDTCPLPWLNFVALSFYSLLWSGNGL